MNRYHSYINTAIQLIKAFKGDQPFSSFVKQFFARERKYGSSDRKQISMLCYSYFRISLAVKRSLDETTLLMAALLCHQQELPIIRQLRPEWTNYSLLAIDEKLHLFQEQLDINKLFPFADALNTRMNPLAYAKSFLVQPSLFVRIRPKYKATVLKKLHASALNFRLLNNDNCIQLASSTQFETIAAIDREVVIQDFNSQQVLNYLKEIALPEKQLQVWDCCAASGGKSILLTDLLLQKIKLTVSDIRTSTIIKLHQRFTKAGIKDYEYLVADAACENEALKTKRFDLVICDAPCTGSGTWSRTPEQLYFFNEASIQHYASMQRAIVTNVIKYLKPGAIFVYITCSVFKEENEAIVAYISQQGLLLLQAQALYGYERQADSMYVAIFQQ